VRRVNTIYRSLNEERMYGGVQRDLAVYNAGFAAIAVLGLGWLWWLVPAIAAHFVMRNINKRDPKILQVYSRYARQGDRYDPWPRIDAKRGLRPRGFSRGMLC